MSDLSFTGPGVGEATALDDLRAELSRKLSRPAVTLDVPDRPGWRIRCDANIRFEDRQRWVAAHTTEDAQRRTVFDALRFSAAAIAEKCDAIIDPAGVVVTENAGEAISFRSPSLAQMMGVDRAADAVIAFFGVDPHVTEAADRLFEAAGYGDTVQVAEDPTQGSSPS